MSLVRVQLPEPKIPGLPREAPFVFTICYRWYNLPLWRGILEKIKIANIAREIAAERAGMGANTALTPICSPVKPPPAFFKIKGRSKIIYAYLRVSTDDQDTENQRMGAEANAVELGLSINKYIIDNGVSGAVDPANRKFRKLLKQAKYGDIFIVSEISRFGRRLFVLFRILETLLNNGGKVYSVKDGYALDNTLQSKVLTFAFGIETECI